MSGPALRPPGTTPWGRHVRPLPGAPPAWCVAAVLALLLALSGARVARADLVDEAWKRGTDAYLRGDYAAALAAYEQLDRQGVVSADLSYNLGVAYFRMGNIGRAIWAFERAVSLDPDADDARFNLDQARKQADRRAVDKIEGAQRD